MAIFRLNLEDDNLHNAELIIAKETNIKLESYLESWLENSPWALVEGEPILWVGRQTSANVEESTISLTCSVSILRETSSSLN